MSELDVQLAGKSLADYTNTQLRLALGAVLYTNTADMWRRYLNQLGYSGDVSQMLQKYYVEYSVPQNFRNYINAGAFVYSPQQLFTDGSKGVVYDNNDLSSFYLDSAGTTAATVNGLVGLQLDKSANLALGAELVTNGDFATDTVWVKGTGWTISGGVATFDPTGQVANSDLYATLSSSKDSSQTLDIAANGAFVALLAITAGGGHLRITGEVSGRTAGTIRILSASGRVYIRALNGTAFDGSVDNISVKELPGNHRYQTTTSFKPVLRGTPTGANLVTNGDFASGTTGWTGFGTEWSVSGGAATKVAGTAQALTQSYAFTAGKVYRITFTVTLSAGSGVECSFNGGTTVFGGVKGAGTHVQYLTALTGNAEFRFTATASFAGTVDNIEIVDVSAGSVTAPYGLQYDGVDDFMQTAAVDFTATDKMFVCAGVRKLSDAATSVVAELSVNSNANAGAVGLFAPFGASQNFAYQSGGTTVQSAANTGFPSPSLAVLTGTSDIVGDTVRLRANGTQIAQTLLDQGTGNYGNYALYFGRRGGASLPYNGLDFGMVICGKTLTSNQISSTERYIAQRTGIAL